MKLDSFLNTGLCFLLSLCTVLGHGVFAQEGPSSGGGGDATAMGVDEIRNNILQWIQAGRAANLKFSGNLDQQKYVSLMIPILAPKYVVVGFVTPAQEAEARRMGDDELQVIVRGVYKQCRGFISKKDGLPHILCSTERYPRDGAEQYRLIHHEFAGLVGVEANVGAASDYEISDQLTDKLLPEIRLRLPITPYDKNEAKYFAIRSTHPGETRYIKIIDANNYIGYRMCDVLGCEIIGDKDFYLKSTLKRVRNLSYAKVGGAVILAGSIIYASAATGAFLSGFFLAAQSSLTGLGFHIAGGLVTGGALGAGIVAKFEKINPMTYWHQANLLRKSLNETQHEVVDLIEFKDTLATMLNDISNSKATHQRNLN